MICHRSNRIVWCLEQYSRICLLSTSGEMKRRRSREKNPEDVETVKNAVAKIHASGDILMKIINDVLDLSKLESGKAELRETVVCLPELIEKLSHMLKYSMEQKKIAFQVVCEITNPYVVCDETKLQQILVNVISMEIDWGENGARCVEKLLDEKSPAYDFILMDIQMPVMDGLEATRQIRACADRKKAQIPIIAMTANAFDEDVKRCLEAGMDAHLSKPLQMNQIMETLAKYCGKQ